MALCTKAAVSLSPDPKDNPILAAAIAEKADLIVSGDKKHMLALGTVEGVPVVTAAKPWNAWVTHRVWFSIEPCPLLTQVKSIS